MVSLAHPEAARRIEPLERFEPATLDEVEDLDLPRTDIIPELRAAG
jgi:hypothetical protein